MDDMLDVLVVGGGINGVAIARDAAGRGWSVCLCEQDDLAAHTSSASTKLIHGGLRYLQYGQFALVRKALMGGFASSRILEVHGERMVKRNFDPGFRIELHQKDLNLALEGARALGLSLPSTAVAQQLFSSCTAHGGKAWDHSAMVRALELMAGHEIAAS